MNATGSERARGGPTGNVEAKVLARIDRELGRVLVLPRDWSAIDSITGQRARSQDVLHRLSRSGWLVQVRRRAYVVRPRSMALTVSTLELVGAISPSLHLVTGGRALAEAGLSDQSFRRLTVLVSTRQRSWEWQGEVVDYTTVAKDKIWGGTSRKVGRFPVEIALAERAILDSLARHALGVSLGQVVEALDKALHRQPSFGMSLAKYAARYGSPVLARRLGFLVERLGGQEAAEPFSVLTGVSRRSVPLLVGGTSEGELDSRWRVIVNVPFESLTDHRDGG